MTVNHSQAAEGLKDRAAVLGQALAHWATRDDSKPDAAVRRAANAAMDEIDAMLGELHAVRQQLMDEMRVSSDAAMARADAMLAARRAGGAR